MEKRWLRFGPVPEISVRLGSGRRVVGLARLFPRIPSKTTTAWHSIACFLCSQSLRNCLHSINSRTSDGHELLHFGRGPLHSSIILYLCCSDQSDILQYTLPSRLARSLFFFLPLSCLDTSPFGQCWRASRTIMDEKVFESSFLMSAHIGLGSYLNTRLDSSRDCLLYYSPFRKGDIPTHYAIIRFVILFRFIISPSPSHISFSRREHDF